MIKKVLIGAGVTMLLGLFFFGRDSVSYLRTSASQVKDSVRSSVPLEFEIERARRMIRDLEPEVQNAMHVIAKQEVEVEKARKQVSDLEARIEKEEAELKKLHGDAQSGKDSFEYGGRKFSREEVKTEMARRFDRLTMQQETQKALKKGLAAREKTLEACRQKLGGMLSARRQLQVDVANLEARQQLIAAAQTTDGYYFDESQLGRVKELVSDLRTRLDVAEKLVSAQTYDSGEIPVGGPASADIVEQIGNYFAQEKTPVAESHPESESHRLAATGK